MRRGKDMEAQPSPTTTVTRPARLHARGVFIFLLVTSFWCVFAVRLQLQTRIDQLREAAQVPFVLNGLELKLDRFVHPPLRATHKNCRYLLFLASDRCTYCWEQLGPWEDLLRRIQFHPDDVVVIVSLHGKQLADRLAATARTLGARQLLMDPVNPVVFGVETGLMTTPLAAVLDGHLRVQASSERITPSVADQLVRVFAEGR
jgi:hypothetical protein